MVGLGYQHIILYLHCHSFLTLSSLSCNTLLIWTLDIGDFKLADFIALSYFFKCPHHEKLLLKSGMQLYLSSTNHFFNCSIAKHSIPSSPSWLLDLFCPARLVSRVYTTILWPSNLFMLSRHACPQPIQIPDHIEHLRYLKVLLSILLSLHPRTYVLTPFVARHQSCHTYSPIRAPPEPGEKTTKPSTTLPSPTTSSQWDHTIQIGSVSDILCP